MLLVVAGYAQDRRVSREEIPRPVMQAFDRSYPGATIENSSATLDSAKTLYEIECLDGRTLRTILYRADGSVVRNELMLAPYDVPEVVRKAVTKSFATWKIATAAMITRGAVVQYVLGLQKGRSSTEVVVSNAGAILKKTPMGIVRNASSARRR